MYLFSNYDDITQMKDTSASLAHSSATNASASAGAKQGYPDTQSAEMDPNRSGSAATAQALRAQTGTSISLPPIEGYTGKHKYSTKREFIKVIKDFKSRPEDFQHCVIRNIHKSFQLQESKCFVKVLKYLIANNNLYVVSEQC